MSQPLSEADLNQLYRNMGKQPPILEAKPATVGVPQSESAKRPVKPKIKPLEGPLSHSMTLWGHCPSKKNDWGRGESGMYLPAEVKKQIETLTAQAMFSWGKFGAPVEHPELTFQFYVAAQRQDRDGMLVTILDCLQGAGVLVNDNIKRNNGTMTILPAMSCEEKDERVEIQVVVK